MRPFQNGVTPRPLNTIEAPPEMFGPKAGNKKINWTQSILYSSAPSRHIRHKVCVRIHSLNTAPGNLTKQDFVSSCMTWDWNSFAKEGVRL
jgi:hypothetical protein